VNVPSTSQTDGPSGLRELLPLWGWTLAVSLLGTGTCYFALPGLNWVLFITAAGTGLAVMAHRADSQQPGMCAAVALLLAVVVAGAACVTADPYSIALIAVSLAALGLYALLAIRRPADALGPLALASAPFALGALALDSAIRRGFEAGAAARKPGFLPFFRGPAMALTLAILLFLLLSAANPTLGEWRNQIAAAVSDGSSVPRDIFFIALATAVLGAYGLAENSTRDPKWPASPTAEAAGIADPSGTTAPAAGGLPWRFSTAERLMVFAAAAAVFALFFTTELATRFGLHGPHLPQGMTFAEATHRGFAEMIIAAGLCALVVTTLDSYALRGTHEWLVRILAWAVIAASLLAVVSACLRVLYYEEAYGYTRLRLYVQACCVAVSMALLLLAWELRGPVHVARLIRCAGMAAILCAASLAYWNVAGWIVQANMERFQHTRKLDTAYLAQLAGSSPDAVPALVESLPQVTAADAASLRDVLRGAAPRRDTAWYEWNLSRTLALSTLCAAGLLPGSDDMACPHTKAPGTPAAEAALPSAPVSAPAQPSSAHSVP
jgi:hypothetical protein